jgi:F-type H+-transporting ATPase subunit delta
MKDYKVARRYAKAVYEIARDSHTLDDVMLSLSNVCLAIRTIPELTGFMFNPLIKTEDILRILKNISSNKIVLKTLSLLAKRKRLSLITVIHDEIVALSDRDKGINRVLIKTASGLSDAEKKNIEKQLSQTLGGQILGSFQVAKELIGGIWVKMGDKVLDASIKGRFDDLSRHLLHSTN